MLDGVRIVYEEEEDHTEGERRIIREEQQVR